MQKIKVLQVVGDPVGGIRKHVHDILDGMNDEFDFVYVSSKNGDKTFYSEIGSITKNIEQHYELHISKKPAITDIRNIITIYKLIKQHNISVVHGHGAKGGLYARLAGRLAGCKVIYTPHGGVVHNMFNPLLDRIYKFVEKYLCRFTDLLIFESHYTANSFDDKFGCKKVKVLVNYNGIKIPTTQSIQPNKMIGSLVKRIGVFGMMREEKGQDLAFDAVKRLIKDGINIELHFFGDGPLKEILESQCKKEKLTESIFFHGEVSNVYENMMNMDFVLIPSRFESFGYVAVEALSLKKSLICSNRGGLSEIANDENAFIFSPEKQENIQTAIQQAILATEVELNIKRQLGVEYVSKTFSLDKMYSSLQESYCLKQ